MTRQEKIILRGNNCHIGGTKSKTASSIDMQTKFKEGNIMKKHVAVVLVFAMLVSLMMPLQAFAQYDKELEKAINTAKSIFQVPKEYTNFTYNINKRNDVTTFDLNWSDTKQQIGNMSVAIDSNGKVINYYSYKQSDYRQQQKKLPAISKQDAKKIAESFLKKVGPQYFGKVKYQENNIPMNINDRNYNFSYMRIENNVPFPENNLSVSVNNQTGTVESYYCNWNDRAVFPKVEGAIAADKAKELFENKLGLRLTYKLSWSNNAQKPYLVYTSVYSNRYIDALTGEVITSDQYYGYDGYYAGGGMSAKSSMIGESGANNQALTPKEKEAVENAGKLIDEAKAEEIVRAKLNIDSTYKLNNINLYNNNWQGTGDYCWSMDFNKEYKNNGMTDYLYANASIDAVTGEFLWFYRSEPYDSNATVKYDEAKCLQIAENFINTIQPEKFKSTERNTANEIRPLTTDEKPRDYSFAWVRKVDGAYFMDNGFGVTVNAVTGTVTNYNLSWYKGDLPSADKAVGLAKAYTVLYNEIGFDMQYISQFPANAKILPEPQSDENKVIKLVYAIKPNKPVNIDANTGKLLDYNGEPLATGAGEYYTDIKGNFAENQIKVLCDYGIKLPGTQLKPNANISQREFLYLVQKSIEPYYTIGFKTDGSGDGELYNALISQGIIKAAEKAPASVVTRQDAVKFIVRALNYQKVADIKKDIYKLPFKDTNKIKPELKGYVAIAYGLDIIDGSQGYFNPTGQLTKAQAFVVLYNFLNV